MPINKDKKILALIPARGDSQEVKHKNMRYYLGRTLLSHTIYTAKQSQYINRIVVCTDDKEIRDEGLRAGAEVVMLPEKAARPDAAVYTSIAHTLTNLPASDQDEKNTAAESFSAFILLQVTSPLREAADIDTALEYYFEKAPTGACVSVSPVPVSPYWMYRQTPDARLVPVMTDTPPSLRRQDLPKCNNLNGAIYIANPAWYLERKSFLTADSIAFEMPVEKALDLKTEYDFQILDLRTRNAAVRRHLGCGIVKHIAFDVIRDYMDLQDDSNFYGVRRASELRSTIRKVRSGQPDSLRLLSDILIDFIMNGKTASDHQTLSFFWSWHRASGTEKNSLRGMFIEKFIKPALGGIKSQHFLQTRDETQAYFEDTLRKLAFQQRMSLPSAVEDIKQDSPRSEALRV
jgi:CMP-N,N'-diacetyllegionaminic acid synthase